MNIFEELKKIRGYAIISILILIAYTCAGIFGYRVMGDDNQVQDKYSGYQRTHSFFHK
jgi:hypothetical protein